jgi:hypothetical protein
MMSMRQWKSGVFTISIITAFGVVACMASILFAGILTALIDFVIGTDFRDSRLIEAAFVFFVIIWPCTVSEAIKNYNKSTDSVSLE